MRRMRLADLLAVAIVVLAATDATGPPAPPATALAPSEAADGRPRGAAGSLGPDGAYGSLSRPRTESTPRFGEPTPAGAAVPPTWDAGPQSDDTPVAATHGPVTGAATPPSPRATPRPTSLPPPDPPTTPAPGTPSPVVTTTAPLDACPILPGTNVWNRPVDTLLPAAESATMIAAIGLDRSLHPDFSSAGGYGIPYNLVGPDTPRATVSFEYDDESDHVGYPIPTQPRIEGGADRHLLMVDTSECRLYELFAAALNGAVWSAGSGATWDLRSNALRPETWTSADAAGLPIFPGLARYDEVAAGEIRHALRFTAPQTCDGYIYPARHEAGSGPCAVYPPMGLRVRLRADLDLAPFGPQARVVLVALQRYGAILADNGSAWYVTGAPSSGWDDDDLHDLQQVTGADFEVVDTTGFVNG